MPQLKIFGRSLTPLERFVVDTPGIVDQVAFGDRLALLAMTVEQNAIRATRDQWMKDQTAASEHRNVKCPNCGMVTAEDSLLAVTGQDDTK